MVGLQAHPVPSREVMREALNIRHGEDLQNKISAARVAVCGLGGLGSNIAIALARAGVGHLHLIDFDRVDLTNLNRQQYAVGQLGQYKTDALRETLSLVSPYCDVTCDTIQVTKENLPDLLKTEDYICEAFDRAEAKAMLVSGVLEHFPEKYLVAASGLAGLGSANTIQTRRVSKRFYLCGDGTSDSSVGLGLVASRVLVCAAHEANMILRLIAGETEP
ncbi:MAG: sulfur carrier protein ThiS adenylyltransferase ThiF [Evtepia sp.]|nr:sulfur carrier protein ThiS adenylyltransferase ThiF [Clostridiales bacterium]